MSEQWRDIPGYEGLYRVSDQGRVASLARTVTASNGRSWSIGEKVLAPALRNGYHLGVSLAKDGKNRSYYLHDLVLRAFVGEPEPGQQGLHKDDDPLNNSVGNLYWGTRRDNLLDAVRNGRHAMANRTECPDGHEYTEENTIITRQRRRDGSGEWTYGRACRICSQNRDHNAARNARVAALRGGL